MALQGEGREKRVVGQVIGRLIPYIFLCCVVGFEGPSVVGWLRKGTESYATGLLFLAAALTIQAFLVLTIRLAGAKPAARS